MVLSAFLVSSCGKVKEPEFKGVENLHTGKLGLQQSTLNLDLLYFNPNRSGLKLKAAEGDAWIDGQFLGHFSLDSQVVIRGNSNFRLPVTFRAETGRLVKNSLLALLGQQAVLKVEGKALVGKSGVFIHYPIRYEGKHNLSELLEPDGKTLQRKKLTELLLTR